MSPLKRTIIEFLIGLPVVVGVYALLDWLYHLLITHTPFTFSVSTCMICVTVWLVIEIISYINRKKKQSE